MPVIEARAIEFVQQMYAGQPGLYPPRGIEDLEHEISHILLGHPPSHFGESYVSSQWRAGLSLAEGDQQDYNNRKEHFVKWSIKPVRRRRIAFTYNHAAFVDGGTDFSDNNDEKTLNPQIITISSPDSFNELMRGPIGAPTNLGLERQKISAGIFFDRTIRDEVMPVTSKLVERYGGRRPEFDEYPNLRIIIDTEEMKIDFRPPNEAERKSDFLIGKIRDMRTGMYDIVNNRALPWDDNSLPTEFDNSLFALVQDPWFSKIAQTIAQDHSQIMMPSPGQQTMNCMTVAEWRKNKAYMNSNAPYQPPQMKLST